MDQKIVLARLGTAYKMEFKLSWAKPCSRAEVAVPHGAQHDWGAVYKAKCRTKPCLSMHIP